MASKLVFVLVIMAVIANIGVSSRQHQGRDNQPPPPSPDCVWKCPPGGSTDSPAVSEPGTQAPPSTDTQTSPPTGTSPPAGTDPSNCTCTPPTPSGGDSTDARNKPHHSKSHSRHHAGHHEAKQHRLH